jgi:hypothetical protein
VHTDDGRTFFLGQRNEDTNRHTVFDTLGRDDDRCAPERTNGVRRAVRWTRSNRRTIGRESARRRRAIEVETSRRRFKVKALGD